MDVTQGQHTPSGNTPAMATSAPTTTHTAVALKSPLPQNTKDMKYEMSYESYTERLPDVALGGRKRLAVV